MIASKWRVVIENKNFQQVKLTRAKGMINKRTEYSKVGKYGEY